MQCGSSVVIEHNVDDEMGSGNVPYDVNLRTAVAFREIGRGHTAIETFCGFMNMPPPMTSNTRNYGICTSILY